MQDKINKKLIDNLPNRFPKKIGGVTVDNPVWLAPLAGITFASLRNFHKNLGAGLVHTEMVSAVGLYRGGRKTRELLNGIESERPVVLQLFASNSEEIIRGAEIALNIRKFEAIQINMACPMPKVTKKGCGSKLLENPLESYKIIKRLKTLGIPIWSKIRIIPQQREITTIDFCDNLFSAGADFIIVHGRTASQRYEGQASLQEVEKVALKFPGFIGGSGDCYTPEIMMDYLKAGCTAVLAARGALRDVFLIPKTLKMLGYCVQDCLTNPDLDAQAKLLLELGRSVYNTEGQALALMISRRMLTALFKGFQGATQIRRRGALARTWSEMEELLLNWEELSSGPKLEFTKDKFPHGVIGEFL